MLTYISDERTLDTLVMSFIQSLTRGIHDVCVTDNDAYLFRDGRMWEKTKRKKKKNDEDDDRRR
jgi:hypothetical protein